MVVQIINVGGVAFLKTEDHPLIRPHRYGPEARVLAFEPMQPEAGQVHILGRRRRIQARQDIPHCVPVIGADAALVAPFE